jgi:hypothetical protein
VVVHRRLGYSAGIIEEPSSTPSANEAQEIPRKHTHQVLNFSPAETKTGFALLNLADYAKGDGC